MKKNNPPTQLNGKRWLMVDIKIQLVAAGLLEVEVL